MYGHHAMNTNHPLALTDRQLQLVRQACLHLKPKVRGLFLQLIATELEDVEVTDDSVRSTISLLTDPSHASQQHSKELT